MTKENEVVRIAWALGAVALVGCGNMESSDQGSEDATLPSKAGLLVPADAPPQTTGTTPSNSGNGGIDYHGGPVMLGNVKIYFIWYGSGWTGNSALTLLPTFMQSLGGSPYWNINTTYSDSTNTAISNSLSYAGSFTDTGSQGQALTDPLVLSIVTRAINAATAGHLPVDTSAIYMVLTSPNVTESSGFCTAYCGWHTSAMIGGSDIKYSFVGNPSTQCPGSCEAQTGSSPNNNPGADGMASVIAHEAEEAVTDPDINAWYQGAFQENGDKCSWTFGNQSTAANGSKYNLTLGANQYLIQQNWVHAYAGYCAMGY